MFIWFPFQGFAPQNRQVLRVSLTEAIFMRDSGFSGSAARFSGHAGRDFAPSSSSGRGV